jgi:hypothetical protein
MKTNRTGSRKGKWGNRRPTVYGQKTIKRNHRHEEKCRGGKPRLEAL